MGANRQEGAVAKLLNSEGYVTLSAIFKNAL